MTVDNNSNDKDNTWKYFAIFVMAYMTFWGLILPIIDELLFNYAYLRFLCEHELFIIPLESTTKRCNSLNE